MSRRQPFRASNALGPLSVLAVDAHQLPDAMVDAHHVLAEAYKRVPNGVIRHLLRLPFMI